MVSAQYQIAFHIVQHAPDEGRKARRQCFLVKSDWDDYGFKTSFSCFLFDDDGKRLELGLIKILRFSQERGYTEFAQPTFNSLRQFMESILSTSRI